MQSDSNSSIDEDKLNALLFTDSEDNADKEKKSKIRKKRRESQSRESSKLVSSSTQRPSRKTEKTNPTSTADVSQLDDELFGGIFGDKSPLPHNLSNGNSEKSKSRHKKKSSSREHKDRKAKSDRKSNKSKKAHKRASDPEVESSATMSRDEALRQLLEEEEKSKSLLESLQGPTSTSRKTEKERKKDLGLLDSEDEGNSAEEMESNRKGLKTAQIEKDNNNNPPSHTPKKPKSLDLDDDFSDDDFLSALADKSPAQKSATPKVPTGSKKTAETEKLNPEKQAGSSDEDNIFIPSLGGTPRRAVAGRRSQRLPINSAKSVVNHDADPLNSLSMADRIKMWSQWLSSENDDVDQEVLLSVSRKGAEMTLSPPWTFRDGNYFNKSTFASQKEHPRLKELQNEFHEKLKSKEASKQSSKKNIEAVDDEPASSNINLATNGESSSIRNPAHFIKETKEESIEPEEIRPAFSSPQVSKPAPKPTEKGTTPHEDVSVRTALVGYQKAEKNTAITPSAKLQEHTINDPKASSTLRKQADKVSTSNFVSFDQYNKAMAEIAELKSSQSRMQLNHDGELEGLQLKVRYKDEELSRLHEQLLEAEERGLTKVISARKESEERADARLKQLKHLHDQSMDGLKRQHMTTLESMKSLHREEIDSIAKSNAKLVTLECIAERVDESTNALEGLQREAKSRETQGMLEREASLRSKEKSLAERENKLCESVRMNQSVVDSFERMRTEHEEERRKVREEDSRMRLMHETWVREFAELKDKLAEDRDIIDEERRELERQKSEWKLHIAAEQQRIERIRTTANRKLAEATSNQTLASTTQKNIQAIVDAETQAALKDREATAILRASVEREQELIKHQAVELSQQKSQAEARMYEISSLGEQVHSQAIDVRRQRLQSVQQLKTAMITKGEVQESWDRLRMERRKLDDQKKMFHQHRLEMEEQRREILQKKEVILKRERDFALREKRAMRKLQFEEAGRQRAKRIQEPVSPISYPVKNRTPDDHNTTPTRQKPQESLSICESNLEKELYEMKLVALNAKGYAEKEGDYISQVASRIINNPK